MFQIGAELPIELSVHMLIGYYGQPADRYQGAQEKNKKDPAGEFTGENM